ncbi:hypothetical protein FLW53_26845 [Microbispora sp. SCL1-1]|uniref:hypothetical protein n=1 Tax=Microbispora TaxID=2005 RepID=UPI00115B5E45|nr:MULTISPECIES: hypothetical protein [unclassified Microbispora]NJP27764.1 hypothetical protein [Microbispora sp. CL1-1]TQS10765.1 hypothetical protein FLW53_26845 [Microbispora sp. SCL1-1]
MVDHPSESVNHWLGVWEVNSLHACRAELGEGRRAWAETAMYALARAEAAGLDAIAANVRRFNLRAYLIDSLGSTRSPLLNPDALAIDILAALPAELENAAEWAADWRQRPHKQLLALRQCKNLLAPAEIIRSHLSETPTARTLDQWLALRAQLP